MDTGKRGEWVTLDAPLEHINLHVRGGYILPWQEPEQNTFLSRQNYMGYKVALDDDGTAQGWLFWDDGKSIDTYENGLYFLAKLNVSKNTLENHIIFDGYFSRGNSVLLSSIEIWGVASISTPIVNMTVLSRVITPKVSYTATSQVLKINVVTEMVSIRNFKSLTWTNNP